MLRLDRVPDHRAIEYFWVVNFHDDQGYDFEVEIDGADLPDAEAQRLAVPTLVRALKAVVERLEGAA